MPSGDGYTKLAPTKTRDAPLRTFNEVVTLAGDAAWVIYMIEVEYDFGELQVKRRYLARSRRSGDGRATPGSWPTFTAPNTSPEYSAASRDRHLQSGWDNAFEPMTRDLREPYRLGPLTRLRGGDPKCYPQQRPAGA